MLATATVLALLLAEAPDSLSGNGGWLGAGLLGAVLAWLMGVHLPSKDKQIDRFIDARDETAKSLNERHATEIREITARFIEEGKIARSEYRAALEMIAAQGASSTRALSEAVASLSKLATEIARSKP